MECEIKYSRQTLSFSDDFKATFTTHYIDPAAMLQMTMNLTCFYLEVQSLKISSQSTVVDRMIAALMHYQVSSKKWFDKKLGKINSRHMNKLVLQCRDKSYTNKQHIRNAVRILIAWEKEAAPLLDYPREITLENGAVLQVPFDFFLLAVLQKQTVKAYFKFHMERLSIANYTAYLNSRNQKEVQKIEILAADLQQFKGVLLHRSPVQQQVFETYRKAYNQLLDTLQPIRAAQNRYPAIREFMNNWYEVVIQKEEENKRNQIEKSDGK